MWANMASLLKKKNTSQAVCQIGDKDVVEKLLRKPHQRMEIFRSLETADQARVIVCQSTRVQKAIVTRLNTHELIPLLNSVDPDQATDLMRLLPDKKAKHLTTQLSEQVREKVEFLLRFHPKTAAGMMDVDYIIVHQDQTFGNVSKLIEKHDLETGRPPIILVMDEASKLLGELPIYALALKPARAKISASVKRLPSLIYNTDEREVVTTFLKHPHRKVVVLDEDKSVLGVIHSDDILAILDKRTTRDLFRFAGVSNEEGALDSPMDKFKHRWLWLVINLGTAFMAASVVGMFEETIAAFTLLAVYMPIVAGMGGNAGTQTMAVAVRGIVLKEIDLASGWKFIGNEILSGAMNGAVNGLIVGLVATFFNHSPMLGVVLAIAMVVNLIIAGFFGAVIPLIMKAFGKDPATSATIFITTCTDVGGFFVFLSLANMLLAKGA